MSKLSRPRACGRSCVSATEISDIGSIHQKDLDSLFRSPDIYVRDMNWMTQQAACLRMSREAYSRSSFLDHRTEAEDPEECSVPIGSLMDAYLEQHPAPRPLMFIAHTALCGSTLLTRCLDAPGACMPYREPYLLHNLSGIWRLRLQKKLHDNLGREEPFILDLALSLLARTYGEAEKPLIKLSDTCTSLLPSILARNPGSRILLLYHDLRRFLIAMLRYPYRREYARNMRIRAEVDLRATGQERILEDKDLNDGRCAALVWMGLMYPYMWLLAAAPDRVRSLKATVFFDDPGGTLKAADEFLDLGIGRARLEAGLATAPLSRHSKDVDQAFDRDRYMADLASAETQFQAEIDDAVEWVMRVSSADPIPATLPNPL